MRILIEGVDLTGKSTLAHHLPHALSVLSKVPGTSFAPVFAPGVRRKGPVGRGDAAIRAERAYQRARDPTSAEIAELFAAAFEADLQVPPGPVLAETYIDHAVALAEVLGHRRAAARLRRTRAHLPGFDATILLVADPDVRRLRLLDRETPNAIDEWLVHDPPRAAALEARLADLVAQRPHVLVLDTGELDPGEAVTRALDHLRTMPMTLGMGQASLLSSLS